MQLGEKIRQLRHACNLTQGELADRCELTKGYISQIENDLTSPSIATLVDILSALGTNLKDFFSASEEEEKIVYDVDHTRALELLVQKQLGRTIKINETGKKRSITIGYSDNEDLNKLLTILCGESFLNNI